MSVELHRRAETLLAEAERLERAGRTTEARTAYRQAAQHEAEVFDQLPPERQRTRGIIAVSTVSFLRRADDLAETVRRAHHFLADDGLPTFARDQLFELLIEARREEQLRATGRTLDTRRINVSLQGAAVGSGLAPLDTVVMKLQQFEKYITRLGEWAAGTPFRTKGQLNPDVSKLISPLLSEPAIGSFQFALRFDAPAQLNLPGFEREAELKLTPDTLADAFFDVIEAAGSEQGDDLITRVPDEQYRVVLAKLVRNLIPDGKGLASVEIRRTQPTEQRITVLHPGLRKLITSHLPPQPARTQGQQVRSGVLRALHLDDGWIVLTEERGPVKLRIAENRIFDDVVGPFVNRHVRVEGYPSRKSFYVTDIELASDDSSGIGTN